MKKNILVSIFFVVNILFFSITCFSEEIIVNSDEFQVNLLSSTDQQTTIEYTFGSFNANPITIEGKQYYQLQLEKEGSTYEKGKPELPKITRSIIIPDDAKCEVKIIESEYVEYQMSIAPSKGILYRDVNPADVPYEFSNIYEKDEFYPSITSELGTPYILRDFRGITVIVYPFTYNPKTQTLRVYHHIKLEINNIGKDDVNVKERINESYNINFAGIYENHFINFNTDRYTSVSEYGRMIVICDASFLTEIQPYVDWKRQKGIDTDLYNVSSIGTTSTQIKNFIQDEYDLGDGLTFVQLVGDVAQIPTYYVDTSYGADPVYSLLDGGDDYPDIFVGRFSATTDAHIETQVERTIHYERDLSSGSWLNWGLGVASDQGPGDDGEYDDEHLDNIRDDLLLYNYNYVGQVYDPGALDTDVTDQFNWGRSFVNYTGHGSTTNWTTSGFDTTDINNLTNSNELPFICSVACFNGHFTGGTTCFGETWLRATHDTSGDPTGAIAIYASSISQPWDPPMDAQDEVTDLLVANEKRTIGGLFFNGSCHMMDEYAGQGDTFKSWNIFGDASLMVRTDTPTTMAVTHNPHILVGDTFFFVYTVTPYSLVCLSDEDSNIISSGYTNYLGQITLSLPALSEGELTLTVTSYNRTTYIAAIPVIGPGTWKGLVSTEWNNAANWSASLIPDATTNVTIPSGTSYSPLISTGNAYCKDLTINSGATLTQTGTSYFYVNGTFNSDAGTFTQSGLSYLYFAGTSNTSWDDDNEDDTYSYVRILKGNNTASLMMWQNMTVDNNFEIREGVFNIDASWTLTVNSTATNAFEVETGGTLELEGNQIIDVAGGVEFEDGSKENVIGGTIKCGGSFTVLANASNNIAFTDGLLELDGSGTQYINDLDGGTLDIYNLTIAKTGGVCYIQSANLDVNGNMIISGGTLSPGTYDINVGGDWTNTVGTAGFTEGTGRVIFDGGNYHQYCSNEIFNELEINKASGGAFRVNGTNVICAAYDWTAGAVDVLSGNFTANYLVDNAIQGSFYLNSGGTINLNNSGYVDLKGDLHIFGGTMTVNGTDSYWPYLEDASIEMSGGVLDFTNCGIYMPSQNTLTTNITGGTIRTAYSFTGVRTDFNPSGGTIELYGSTDAYLSMETGSNFYNVLINKAATDDNKVKMIKPSISKRTILDRDGSVVELTRSNTVTATSELDINGDFILDTGIFDTNGYDMYVAGDWANNVGEVEFVEGVQKVVFDGAESAAILSPETFYDLHIDKTYSGFAGLETGFGNDNGVDVTVTHNLELIDGTMELNNPTNLVIGNNIVIFVGASLNANDSGIINISLVEDWWNYNISGGFDAGTTSVVTFNGTTPGSLHAVRENEYFNDIVINSGSSYVRPSSPGGTTIYCKNMDIVQGKLNIAGYRVVVDEALSISGVLEMSSPNDSLFVGDITWQTGSSSIVADGKIFVSGNWTNSGGTFSPGTSTVIFDSSGDPQDVNGTNIFYDIQQVNTGNYLRFNGNTTINNLELNFYSWAYNTFNVNGTLNINNPSSRFTANGSLAIVTIANLDQGGTVYCNGEATITINDLVESVITGTYYADDVGGTINLSNGGSTVDLEADLYINGGTMNIAGNFCYWPYNADASITMTDGVLDVTSCGIYLYGSNTLTETITGGTIRTAYGFTGPRTDFNPTGGTIELYGPTDASLGLGAGSNFYNVLINKAVSDEITKESKYDKKISYSRDGSVVELTRSNTITAASELDINGNFVIDNGVFDTSVFDMYVARDWMNNVDDDGFVEGIQTVTFDGSTYADILTNETFFNLTINRISAGFDGFEMVDGITINVLNNLNILDGTLEMNTNSTLSVANDVQINLDAGLNAGGYDTGLNLFVGGNWTNDNPNYDTIYGYTPGGEIITFNGSADQFITTQAPQEDFGHLVIDKTGGEFRSNDNIRVINDLDILAGCWHDNAGLLTHYFEGDFYITAGTAACWNSLTGNTVVFKGINDQTVYNPIGYHYFRDIVIDKTAWSTRNIMNAEGAEFILSRQDNVNLGGDVTETRAMTVTLNSNIDMEFGDGLTIDEGILDLNGMTLQSMGDIIINDGGTLIVDEGAILKVDDGVELAVNSGGTLEVLGALGNLATITNRSTGNYDFNVNSGGIISTEYGLFEYMTMNGVFVMGGGIVDPLHSFNYCTFQNGLVGYATLLLIDNADDVTITGANFPDVSSSDYNVAKTLDQGTITMLDATGIFAGEAYELDDHLRIHWTSGVLPVIDDLTIQYNAVSEEIELTWTYSELFDHFNVYRSTDPYDFSGADVFTTPSVGYSETATGTNYFYQVTAENTTDNGVSSKKGKLGKIQILGEIGR